MQSASLHPLLTGPASRHQAAHHPRTSSSLPIALLPHNLRNKRTYELGTRRSAKGEDLGVLFHLHNNSSRCVQSLLSFHGGGSRFSESFANLPEVAQPISSGAGMQTRVLLTPRLHPSLPCETAPLSPASRSVHRETLPRGFTLVHVLRGRGALRGQSPALPLTDVHSDQGVHPSSLGNLKVQPGRELRTQNISAAWLQSLWAGAEGEERSPS